MPKNDRSTDYKDVAPPPAPDASSGAAGGTSLIDIGDLAAAPAFLGNVQGNILKGHGRDHIRLVFLRFTVPADEAKAALREYIACGHVQSARTQREHEVRFKRFGVPGPLFSNVLLSATGYRKLGFTDLSSFDEKPQLPTFGSEVVTFTKGAKAPDVVAALGDPPVATWEQPFRDDIDALILLADDDPSTLVTVLNETIELFKAAAEIVHVQSGDALRNRAGDTIEHFGYIDGRSQPVFYQQDLQKEIAELDGEDPALPGARHYLKFDPRAEKELVLVPDPLATGSDNFGSYFVFRKLEQNVRGFKQQEQSLADRLGLSGDNRELAGAYVVGRFEDGTPVVMRDRDGLREPIPNNFDYAPDPEGQKCPFHSHIRKMNPRGDTVRAFAAAPADEPQLLAEERGRRIARRGITYGDRVADPSDPSKIPELPTRDVGLLFMCFQANIPSQFAFLQQSWANNEAFVKAGTGLDPVIGQQRDLDKPVSQKCPLSWGQPGSIRADFSGFVTLKGGEFFFAPSIPFLDGL